jgi:hypothetical protein
MKSFSLSVSCTILAVVLLLIGCAEKESLLEPESPDMQIASCVGCHTNYEALKELADPEDPPAGGGCGGPPPFIPSYDRVYLDAEGYDTFKYTVHGALGCTECHGGVNNTSNKQEAHSADFVKHPSTVADQTCASCHPDIVQRTANSLHAEGWGQKRSQAIRAGVASFDELPHGIREGYSQNCATCHATCGDCHVTRPPAGGGGLYKGHVFNRTPDMRDNCVACHSSRGGHAYFGIGTGTQPDVHLTQAGYTCISCHSMNELHGDGNTYDTRYEMALLPQCTDCHTDIASANVYHSLHIDDFNCHTCHSQNYNNCGSCHVGGEGARIYAHQSFKIALNPMPDQKPYKFATVRRTPAAPDSWELYGTVTLSDFEAKTTFNYTTPHNILRWTSRTKVDAGKSCYDNCHIIQEEDTYRNRNLYLFGSDLLEDWERSTNQEIIVDGKLPSAWGTP